MCEDSDHEISETAFTRQHLLLAAEKFLQQQVSEGMDEANAAFARNILEVFLEFTLSAGAEFFTTPSISQSCSEVATLTRDDDVDQGTRVVKMTSDVDVRLPMIRGPTKSKTVFKMGSKQASGVPLGWFLRPLLIFLQSPILVLIYIRL